MIKYTENCSRKTFFLGISILDTVVTWHHKIFKPFIDEMKTLTIMNCYVIDGLVEWQMSMMNGAVSMIQSIMSMMNGLMPIRNGVM